MICFIKSHRGQALIETALVLLLLLFILLGITEFSRAWYRKSSLKNAVRHGVRKAVVEPSLIPIASTNCPSGAVIVNDVCTSPGVLNDARTTVSLALTDDADSSGDITKGDTIQVTATLIDATFFIVGNNPWPWPKGINISVDASMRYE